MLQAEDVTKQFAHFLISCQWRLVRELLHPIMPGKALLYEVDGKPCLVWQTLLSKQTSYARYKQLTLLKQLNNHSQFVKFRGVMINPSEDEGMFVLVVIFDYYEASIDEWFDSLLNEMSSQIDVERVTNIFWRCLTSVVTALLCLQRSGIYHGQLHSKSLLMCGDEVRLLFNPAQPTSVELLRDSKYWEKLLYLAPEEFAHLRSNQDISTLDQRKCDVSNCGMIFVHLLMKFVTVSNPKSLHSPEELHESLIAIKKVFGFEVYDVLQSMTKQDPRARPDFYELIIQLEDIAQLNRKLHARSRASISVDPKDNKSPREPIHIFRRQSALRNMEVEHEGCITSLCYFRC